MWLNKKDKRGGKEMLGQCIFVLMISVGATFNVFAQEDVSSIKEIELFVKSGTAIVRLDEQRYPDIKAVIHVVDEVDMIQDRLNQLLKKTTIESEARKLVAPFFRDPEFMTRFKRAYMAQLQAKRYQLREYPSAVINRGEGLVLGDVDMNSVVERVQQRGLRK